MSFPSHFDGSSLQRWVRRAVAELAARRHEINALNVFPVPDSDTGSNMAHTMESALAAVDKLEEGSSAAEVARAMALGGVRGARGNSGVVLSQVLRAIAEAAATQDGIGGQTVADALSTAVRLVDRAIMDPVEGTVVTVLRAASVAARQEAASGGDLHSVLSSTVAAAQTALAHTPSQLPALREAGVVDAGGAGLVVLLQSLLDEVESAGDEEEHHHVAMDDPAFRHELEIMFSFEGNLDALESTLRTMGTSLVIAREAEHAGTVHIHSEDAGAIIEEAYRQGAVSRLRLEVLPVGPLVADPTRMVVAICAPGEVAELFRQVGAVVVYCQKGREEDVVADILDTIGASKSQEIILLPNGLLTRRQLAAVDKAVRAFDSEITLLPTNRMVSGLAALTVHDERQPLATDAYTMAEAAASMRTAVIVPQGEEFMARSHGQIVAQALTLAEVTYQACTHLLEGGGEQVSILSEAQIDGEALEERLGVDVLTYPGSGLNVTAEIGVE